MLSKIYSLALFGINSEIVTVETDIAYGLPKFYIVGLGDQAVKEAKERVRSAIKNSEYSFPTTRITINLAPANLKKNGVYYDLPIALGILQAKGFLNLKRNIKNSIFIGELALDGSLRPVKGVLPLLLYAKAKGFKEIFLPLDNFQEASLVEGLKIWGAKNLIEIIDHLQEKKEITNPEIKPLLNKKKYFYDFNQIKGQFFAKRALEIASAGAHNVLFCGSPGSGKTLMAKAFPSILPKMTFKEKLEVTKLYSIANKLSKDEYLIEERPFRVVHHTASDVSLVGGGQIPSPGEISLAHLGVLFLDELPEFKKTVLEVLRQPLEDKEITVTRVQGSSSFPADFILLSAMNPCPCGYYQVPNSKKECTCSFVEIQKYQKKISGPLYDRIDLYVPVSPVTYEDLKSQEKPEKSSSIRERVEKAREIQTKRFKTEKTNSQMNNKEIEKYCVLDESSQIILKKAQEKFNLSARSYFRVLKVARTIADLEESERVLQKHLMEALQYKKQE
jgi:magnesium chelatase family protein